jgi:arylsulfatase A-like enzyme
LRDRKGGAAYDGGYRVPCIARQPGIVKAGQRTHSIAMGIDFLPTFCAMAGIPDRKASNWMAGIFRRSSLKALPRRMISC